MPESQPTVAVLGTWGYCGLLEDAEQVQIDTSCGPTSELAVDRPAIASSRTSRAPAATATFPRTGAVVLVEPVSGAPAYPLKRAADAVVVIDRVEADYGVGSLRLLADLYHLAVNGDDVEAAIDSYAARIGHVQIADAPGRGEPGTGTLDIPGYLNRLAGHGYRGYVGLEYKSTRQDTFDWLPREQRASRAGL